VVAEPVLGGIAGEMESSGLPALVVRPLSTGFMEPSRSILK